MAGPDDLEGVGYRLALPAARHGRLADFRVLVLDEHPIARSESVIRAGLDALAGRLEKLGAKVARESPLLPDLAAELRAYRAVLKVVSTRGKPGVETVSAHEWIDLLDTQQAARPGWARLFEAFDVVLTPVIGVAAFPPKVEAPETRTIDIDGRPTPYFDQVAWAGVATYPNLPATAAPLGRTSEGLPFGVQIVGPYLEDRTTIAFAGLLEREFGGFSPPAGY